MSSSESNPDTHRVLKKDSVSAEVESSSRQVSVADLYDVQSVPSASGGFAQVFRARSKKTGQWKAIKRLHPLRVQFLDFTDFQREIEALRRLQHPSIAALQDFGEDDQGPYIVMDWVEGISLRQYLQQQGPLHPQRFCQLAIKICEGLEYAHNNGVLHLDIKPDNIMLDVTQHIRLIDLGISRLILTGDSSVALRVADSAGTPSYASPEQMRNEGVLSGSSDVYSLGRTFYELLTGHLPGANQNLELSSIPHFRELLSAMLEENRDIRIQRIDEVRCRLQDISRILQRPEGPSLVGDESSPASSRQVSDRGRGHRLKIVITVSVVLSVAAILKTSTSGLSFITVTGTTGNVQINGADQTSVSASENRIDASMVRPAMPPAVNEQSAADAQSSVQIPTSITLPDLEFVLVRMKPFEMGHRDGRNNEAAVWVPTVSEFWISRTEVTQSQWSLVMRTAPWRDFSEVPRLPDAPAVAMTFREVRQFIDELSRRDSLTYDLPTEPEWEYACRGPGSWQSAVTSEFAHTRQSRGGRLQSVRRLSANSLGLYDMLGNAAEWTRDVYRYRWQAPDAFTTVPAALVYRSVRGGHWNDNPEDCQPWSRAHCDENSRPTKIGFRLVARATTSVR